MNKGLVKKLKDKLDNLHFSDYNGLKSPGLTCYLNSVLQVLFMTEDFRDAVKRSGSKNTTIDSDLAELFDALERTITTTHAMIELLGITNVYEQQDAAEYFEKILCRTSREASQIFQGELSYNAKCHHCKEENHSRNLFWLLPLPMGNFQHDTYNVEDGLNSFFKVQKVSGDNQLYCTRCKKKQDADLKCEITQAPGVLTLLLKRFTFDYRRRCYVKLQCSATVPRTFSIERCTYDLYAVVNHFGTLTGGHYTAEIKSFQTGWWYCFNDNVVKSLKTQPFGEGETFFSSCSAYILIYRKVNKAPDEADGRDLEAQFAQSDVEDEKRRDEAEPGGEASKLLNGGLGHMSWDVPVTHRSVDTLHRRGIVPGVAPLLDDSGKQCKLNSNKPKQHKVRSYKQEAAQTVTRGRTRGENSSKMPWRY